MKISVVKVGFVYVFASLSLAFAGLQLVEKPVKAFGCCTYGVDCGAVEACCFPREGESDCSEDKKNHCRDDSGTGNPCAPAEGY